MIKIAIYGKGGIGKSTIVSNLSAAMADMGLRVMQIGCDPKADSTICVRQGHDLPTVLEVVRAKKDNFSLEDVIRIGYKGIICVEAGGPIPGVGCAGRGIITALDKLEKKGAYEKYKPDVVFYDVLGDVVCGGFSMPMREGYAQSVYIVTSGENMSIYAAANISMALDNFKGRGYASLGGLILNERNVKDEYNKVFELSKDINTDITGIVSRSSLIEEANLKQKTVVEAYKDSKEAYEFKELAKKILQKSK